MTAGGDRTRRAAALARELRSPDSGIVGQGVRFAITGAVVAVVYFAVTSALHLAVGLPFQLALLIGFLTALGVHFTLQRVFVWRHHAEFALAFHHQLARYLCVSGAQYGLTAASTALLPHLLGLPVEVVYFLTVVVIAVANFLLFRSRVFHAEEGALTPLGTPITSEFDAVEPQAG